MMTEELTDCPKCAFKRALTHYSSDGLVHWIACPKCKTFFDHMKEKEEKDVDFWKCVEKDTEYFI